MVSFSSDYTQGAHEQVLRRLIETNMEFLPGYGEDSYCASAKEKIKTACEAPDADVYFLVGGTQSNQMVISSLLRSHEGVMSVTSGHVNTHEAGAIEHAGHKVIALDGVDGKLNCDDVRRYIVDFYADANHEAAVFPGMVYISHPTEYGTLYTKAELEGLSAVCREFGIPLFLDGARLGYGLMSSGTDVTLPDIARLCDVFYIGGTKVGALCGEALVFTRKNMPAHFSAVVKQKGALLAKGRLLGVQFDALFTDDLYFKISRNAIEAADKIRALFRARGYQFLIETVTNQVFIVLDNNTMQELAKYVTFGFWEKVDDTHTAVRFASSWATSDADIAELEAALDLLSLKRK